MQHPPSLPRRPASGGRTHDACLSAAGCQDPGNLTLSGSHRCTHPSPMCHGRSPQDRHATPRPGPSTHQHI